jgi:ATP adenylyltransferase
MAGLEITMEHIWAPWRMDFILKSESGGCFLCQKPKENHDEGNYILYRGQENYILLNAYPYNPGHLLVAPYRHIGFLQDLTETEAKEHFDLVRLGVKLLTKLSEPAGFNVGMNLGTIAGAGVADHIHSHIVPRWQGDTNFMPVIGETKVLPEALISTYKKMKNGLSSIL